MRSEYPTRTPATSPSKSPSPSSHGTLSLSGVNGLTFSPGSGPNGAAMTFTGTIANINAALNGMQFQATSGFQGTAHLQVTTNDLGHSGTLGEPQMTTNTLAINVRPVTSPTIAMPQYPGIDEHQSIVFSTGGGNAVRISDPDVGNLPVQVTLATDYGTLSLSGVNGLTFATGSGPNGATMTFRGTIANINAALNGMTFTPNDYQTNTTAQIRITVNDLCLGYTGPAYTPVISTNTVFVNITAVNDPPVITFPSLLGRDPTQILFSTATGNPIRITDPDAGNNPVEVTIETSESTFTLADTAGLSIRGGSPGQQLVHRRLRNSQ